MVQTVYPGNPPIDIENLITIILVSQFNSVVKPAIIMASVIFSTIGVFGGIATFKMDFIVIMTGIGIVALAGIVVNNAIVLIDYIDLLRQRKRRELGLIPLASGMNIDFGSFLSTFDAKIYFGGDNTAFWGPISWIIIFGLSFATFLTLVIVPAMYHVLYIGRIKISGCRETKGA